MASVEATQLLARVKARIGNKILVNLTNDDSSVTVVDDNVLLAACDDCLGQFNMESGHAYDDDDIMHVSICVSGALAMLESYKGRSSSLIQQNRKNFFAACQSLRNKTPQLFLTNSQLQRSEQKGLPDMDRSRTVFRKKRR